MNISLSTEKNEKIFDGILCKEKNFDILKRDVFFAERPALLYMIDGFVKEDLLEKILVSFYKLKAEDAATEEQFRRAHIPYSSLSTEKSVSTLVTEILSGKTVLIVEGFENAFVMELRSYPQRENAEPDRDKVMRGSRDGFTEGLTLNAALVRRRIRDSSFCVEYHSVGVVENIIAEFAKQRKTLQISVGRVLAAFVLFFRRDIGGSDFYMQLGLYVARIPVFFAKFRSVAVNMLCAENYVRYSVYGQNRYPPLRFIIILTKQTRFVNV